MPGVKASRAVAMHHRRVENSNGPRDVYAGAVDPGPPRSRGRPPVPRAGAGLCRGRARSRPRGAHARRRAAGLSAAAQPARLGPRAAATGTAAGAGGDPLGRPHGVLLSAVAGRHAGAAQGLSRADRARGLRVRQGRQEPDGRQAAQGPLGAAGGHDGHARGGVPLLLSRAQRQGAGAQHPRLRRHRPDRRDVDRAGRRRWTTRAAPSGSRSCASWGGGPADHGLAGRDLGHAGEHGSSRVLRYDSTPSRRARAALVEPSHRAGRLPRSRRRAGARDLDRVRRAHRHRGVPAHHARRTRLRQADALPHRPARAARR